MLDFYFQDTDTIRRLRKGMFGEFMDLYANELQEAGYSWQSAQTHLRLVEGFGGWLRYCKIDVHQANSRHIEKYVGYRNRNEQRTKSTGILTALKRMLRLVATTEQSSSKIRTDNRTPA